MNKKNNMKRIKTRILAVIALGLLTAIISVGYIQKKESNDFKLVKNLDIFYSLVRELNTFYVDGIDPDKLIGTGIDEMLKTLDPYTTYYSESEIDDFQFMTTGKYGGVGSLIRKDGDYAVLTEIYRGFPADLAGLKAGDILLEIDGRSLKGFAIEKISDNLKGDPNTEVTVKVRRGDSEISRTMTRKRIVIPPVPYFGMLDNNTGYIRFTNFTQDCSKDVKNALISLKNEKGAQKIILDIRGNPGGLLTEAVEIVNLFVGPGQEVVSTRGKVNQYDATYKTSRSAVDENIPLVVMINSNSASASEILAGAIQDLDRGVIIGQRSYGKGLVQISRPLSYNSSLKVTTAKYYIPSGRCIQALDFTHRNEDGSVGHIPDSLISEFKTKNGRIVRDGGGILPDYQVEQMQLSQISAELFLRSFFFDFATIYSNSHENIDGPGMFSLSDDDYSAFISFLKERGFSYNTATEDALGRLESMAKREKYFDSNQELFNNLREKLGHNLDNDMLHFKPEIVKLLEDEIIGRYFYEEGTIIHTLRDDLQVKKAIEVLNDEKIYSSTLDGRAGSLTSRVEGGSNRVNNFKLTMNEPIISC